jgi:sensor histidine kinase YesM
MLASTETLKDKWFRVIGIPMVALVAKVLFFYDKEQDSARAFLTGYVHSIFHAWILWEIARLMIIWTRRRYGSFADSDKRIQYTLSLVTLTTIVVMTAICAFYDITKYWGYHFTFKGYVYNVFVALMYAVIIGGIYEGIYFFRKWREAFVETEALKQSNLQSQLDSLKGQINPHFLFNSLSSLSSLIADDCTRAEKFVDELAAVYRYLLQTNQKQLTTLHSELGFISAYFHLLKTRFSEGLHLQLDIDDRYSAFLLPPLTLQILIENAVKHNVLLQSRPLTIRVYTDESNNLIVMNNLQKKNTIVDSNRMGLSNIVTKYRLLKQRRIVIRETEGHFQVVIPLIRPVVEYGVGE